MSRIGRMPVPVPAGVTVTIGEDSLVTVKGPKGTLAQKLHPRISLKDNGDGNWIAERPTDEKQDRALHGLVRTLFNNMVVGVTKQFTKELDVVGVGYSAVKNGKQLTLKVGYSHPVYFEDNDDIAITVPAPNKIIVTGNDKQKVGQFAAEIREVRPPEPYKGKGIRYTGEHVRRKEGKAGGKKK